MVDRVFDEYILRNMKEASNTVADDKLSKKPFLLAKRGHPKYSLTLSHMRNPDIPVVVAVADSVATAAKNSYRMDVIRYSIPSLTSLPSVAATAVLIWSISAAKEVTVDQYSL